MSDDDAIKAVFHFYIIDLIIFGVLAYVLALVFFLPLWFYSKEVGRTFYPIIAFLLLILLMYWNYKYRYQKKFKEADATKILQLRFAKGEITKEEFEQMKKILDQ